MNKEVEFSVNISRIPRGATPAYGTVKFPRGTQHLIPGFVGMLPEACTVVTVTKVTYYWRGRGTNNLTLSSKYRTTVHMNNNGKREVYKRTEIKNNGSGAVLALEKKN